MPGRGVGRRARIAGVMRREEKARKS
eukprot:COSAG01_NODE_22945_length_835_cov_1.048913_1_plen_25_part_01